MAHVSLVTAAPAVPPRRQLARPEACVPSPHTRRSVCRGGFLTSLCPSDAAPSLHVYFSSPGSISLQELVRPQPGGRRAAPALRGDSAPSRPSAPQNPHRGISSSRGETPFPVKEGQDRPLGKRGWAAASPEGRAWADPQGWGTWRALPHRTARSKAPLQRDDCLTHCQSGTMNNA